MPAGTGNKGKRHPRIWKPSGMKMRELATGVSAKIAWGEKLMLSLVVLAPGAVVPEHSHRHEQMGILISGTMKLSIGGKTDSLAVNDMYLVPGGVPHDAKAGPEGAVALDAFSPPREEYKPRPPAAGKTSPAKRKT